TAAAMLEHRPMCRHAPIADEQAIMPAVMKRDGGGRLGADGIAGWEGALAPAGLESACHSLIEMLAMRQGTPSSCL
ncbi:hypothetical protein, partial [Salmonella sp. SAL4432]|uniref:hypothetical protein n=1 Tax=Salmonella sp. SAL4432 TaxID=3159887 RepID=UPI003979E7B7